MSVSHTIEDGVLNDILHELRLIKAVGGTLMSASVSGDELEPDEIGSLACLVHDSSKNIMQTLDAVESEVRGVETPAAPKGKITDTETFKKLEEGADESLPARKLSDYDSQYANAKVSVLAMWKHLEALEAAAGDPAKVKAWGERVWLELQKCEVCLI